MHLVEVQEELAAFETRGLQVIAVGQGTGEQAKSFCQQWGVAYPCLGDSRRNAYKVFALRRGNWWNVVLRGLLTKPVEAISLIAKADMKGAQLPSTDVLQLAGIAIIDQQGIVRGLHRAQSPEDMPPAREVAESAAQILAAV